MLSLWSVYDYLGEFGTADSWSKVHRQFSADALKAY